MSWGKIAFSALLSVLLLILFFTERSYSPIRLQFELSTEKDIEFEVFYTSSEKQAFVAGKSISYLYRASKSGSIYFDLPVEHLHKVRIDFGVKPGDVRIDNIKVSGKSHFYLTDFDNISPNDIDRYTANGGLVLSSQKIDPYIIFNTPIQVDAAKKLAFKKGLGYFAIIFAFIAFAVLYILLGYFEKSKHKRANAFLLFLFFSFLLIPASKINKEDKAPEENRMLAKFPSLITEKKINNNFGIEFETWFNDRFYMRKQLVRLYNKITAGVNRNLFKEKVLVGKDGWSFNINDDGVKNYQNVKLFSDKELEKLTLYLSSIDHWCKANNKKFYFFVAPDNHKIYGEYFRFARKIKPDSESRIFQLIHYLQKNTGVEIIYPYEAFLEAKNDGPWLYYKNDAHWTYYGAFLGYKELMKSVYRDFQIAPISYTELDTYYHPYGESNLLYPGGIPLDSTTVYHKLRLENNYTANNRAVITEDLYLNNNQGKGSLFMLRDSFGNVLEPYLGNTFEHVVMKWRYNITREDLQYITEKDIDVVVLLAVERLVPSILYSTFPKD